MSRLLFLTTGGTIDKDYPRSIGGYAFEFGERPVVERVLQMARVDLGRVRIVPVCAKDSTELTAEDR